MFFLSIPINTVLLILKRELATSGHIHVSIVYSQLSIYLISTLLMRTCNCNNLTENVSLQVSLLFPWLRFFSKTKPHARRLHVVSICIQLCKKVVSNGPSS